jgi:hypothetical protein
MALQRAGIHRVWPVPGRTIDDNIADICTSSPPRVS